MTLSAKDSLPCSRHTENQIIDEHGNLLDDAGWSRHRAPTQDLIARYLTILKVDRVDPDLGALRELLAAHFTRIPFENISKLYYRKRFGLVNLPAVQLYLDGIDKYHFGGTCYSNNYHFHLLLRSLGYEAKLCAGTDMNTPAVHAVNMVTIDGREYLADTGYAAPLLDPIPRDLETDYEIRLGRDHYVLKPQDANGCSHLELYLGPESCAVTARDTVKRRQGNRRSGLLSCENIQPGRRRG